MKSAKINTSIQTIGLMLVAFTLALLGSLGAVAQQNPWQNPYPVPAVTVHGLNGYHGKYLSAYYVSGYPSGFATNAADVNVRNIYVKIGDLPITADTLTLPAQSISWQGAFKPSILLLVVHDQAGFTWQNGNNDEGIFASAVFISVLARNVNAQAGTTSVNYIFDPKRPLSGN